MRVARGVLSLRELPTCHVRDNEKKLQFVMYILDKFVQIFNNVNFRVFLDQNWTT